VRRVSLISLPTPEGGGELLPHRLRVLSLGELVAIEIERGRGLSVPKLTGHGVDVGPRPDQVRRERVS
jgi:hypothetical protein